MTDSAPGADLWCPAWSATKVATIIPRSKIDRALVAPLGCSGAPLEWSEYTRQAEVHRYQGLGEPGCESLAEVEKKRPQRQSDWQSVSALRVGPMYVVDPIFALASRGAGSPCVSLRLEHCSSRLIAHSAEGPPSSAVNGCRIVSGETIPRGRRRLDGTRPSISLDGTVRPA